MEEEKIEIEIKFNFTKQEVENVAKFSKLISESTFTDIYFDTTSFDLTKNNFWLRQRDQNFELKIPTPNSSENGIFSYQEMTQVSKIEQELFTILNFEKKLTEMIEEKILVPYCKFISYRTKYKFNEFTFDFDETDFGFKIGELELIVPKCELKQGKEKLEQYFNTLNLTKSKSMGKLVEFIKEKNPQQYQIVVGLLLKDKK